ncbi:MAG: response regulator [bacterium]
MGEKKQIGELGRKLPVDKLIAGDKLFDEVRGNTGGQLFMAGEVISENDIKTMKNFGVENAWVYFSDDMKTRLEPSESSPTFQTIFDDIEKDIDSLRGAVSPQSKLEPPAVSTSKTTFEAPTPATPFQQQSQKKTKQFVRSAKMKIDKVVAGMALAEEVRSISGAIIIAADTILSQDQIDRLVELGITSVFIETCDIPKELDPLRKKTVIVVDDSLFFRHMFAKMLYRMGMLVCGELKSGEEAINSALIYKPDLLVVDIHLPGIDGRDVIKKLRPRLPNTKFLAVSSHKDRDTIIESLKSGAHDFIAKPIQWDTLKPRLLKLFPADQAASSQR